MKILPNVEIVDLALYFDSALVIADIHIGYEEALNKQGVLVPRQQFEDMAKRMEKIFRRLKGKRIERIVVNGDLKHEFGTISEQEWRNTLKFIDLLAKRCNEVVLVKGNHDTILGPIARKRHAKVVNNIGIGKVLVCHGNKMCNIKNYDTIIIGHEHPAVTLKEGPRIEQYKCFLRGKYKGRNLIVQPSFNSLVEGTNLLRDEILSPFLQKNLTNFEVYIVEDKVYHFGKLKGLRKH